MQKILLFALCWAVLITALPQINNMWGANPTNPYATSWFSQYYPQQWLGSTFQNAIQQMIPQGLVQTFAKSSLPSAQFDLALEQDKPNTLGYKVMNEYPHDRNAFTQGLFIQNNTLYESTGLYGQSTIRKVDIPTGRVTQMSKFSDSIFSEGITSHANDGKIYGLSWHERLVFRINPTTFRVEKEFQLPNDAREGWGITSDGKYLIMSDSSQNLFFIDPSDESFKIHHKIVVYDPLQKSEVPYVNELEYINGKIYGNVYGLDHIAIINPENGIIENWIDCRGLWKGGYRVNAQVLNGIAYDSEHKKIYVTGKNWPTLYEIEVVRP